jgi:protein-tyrosine-phosphatase
MTTVLIIGASDTGRAPIAAALLSRRVAQRGLGWAVESAGVVGHDGEPAQPEARATMAHLGLTLDEHLARSLSDELVAGADLLLAIDSGTARVLRARFPEATTRVAVLGDLAGRQRDIPDPFRMQVGAWIAYARELDALLADATPRIADLLRQDAPATEPAPHTARRAAQAPLLGRIDQLLRLAAEMPGVIDWAAASKQIAADLGAATADETGDAQTAAYVALLRDALAATPAPPNPGQLGALREAFGKLAAPIVQDDVAWLAAQLPGWPAR